MSRISRVPSGDIGRSSARAMMSAADSPARNVVAVIDPADVPTMMVAFRGFQPRASSSALRTPAWNAPPVTPPAPRTNPTRGGRNVTSASLSRCWDCAPAHEGRSSDGRGTRTRDRVDRGRHGPRSPRNPRGPTTPRPRSDSESARWKSTRARDRSRWNTVIERKVTRGPSTATTSSHDSTTPEPGTSTSVRVSSGVHCSHARRCGSRVSNTSTPPALNAALTPRNVAPHSSSVRNTWATLPVMNAASTLNSGNVVASPCNHSTTSAPGFERATSSEAERGIDRYYPNAPSSEQAHECPRAAPHIQHRGCPQLPCDFDIDIQVTAVGIERIVDRRKARVIEDRVWHTPILAPCATALNWFMTRDYGLSSSATRAWTRRSISSRIGRTPSMPWPAGSSSAQSRYRLPG